MNHHSGIMAWFAKNHVAANLFMIIILVLGYFTLSDIRTEAFPSFPPETVSISVSVNGGGIQDIEESVVLKIEEALVDVQGIDIVRSTIVNGSASVRVTKQDDYDLAVLKEDIEAAIDSINNFPTSANQPVIEAASRQSDAIWIAVYGDSQTKVLKAIADDLRSQLLQADTIKQVDTVGEPTEEIGITLSEQVLQRYGWTINEVSQQIKAQSVNQFGGELSSNDGDITVRGDFQAYYRSDFESLVIQANTNGALIRLGDVATVKDSFSEQAIVSRFNGQNAIMIKVVVTGDTSLIDASEAAKSVMWDYRQTANIPANVQLETMGDQSVFISDRIDTMVQNGLIGMLLVIILLALFLHPVLALWVAVGIPIAFAGAIISMGPLGLDLSLNELTTSGFLVALGILVDDAIVIAESVYSTRKQGDKDNSDAKQSQYSKNISLTVKGAMKVAVPATFGVLTTIAAFYPLMFIDGRLGNILSQQAMVVIAVLIFALIESKLILPSHLAQIKIEQSPKNTLWNRIQSKVQGGLQTIIDDYYAPSIRWVLRHRWLSFTTTVLIFVMTIALIPLGQVKISFFPDIEPTVVMASFEVQESFGKSHTHTVIDRMETALVETNQALKEKYAMNVDPITAIYVSSSTNSAASITGELVEDSLRDFDAAEVSTLWRNKSGDFEGMSVLNFDGARRGPSAIQIELKASELTTLNAASVQLRLAMSQIEGVKDVRDNLKVNQPQLSVKIKPAAYSLGLSNTDVMSQVSAALYGSEAQKIQRGNDEVSVMVRYPTAERTYLSSIDKLMIRTAEGANVPFYTVAETIYSNSVSQIDRLDRYRATSVIGSVDKRIISSEQVIKILQNDAIPMLLQSYPDLKIELKGEASEQNKSTTSLSQGLMIALLVIYGLLAIPLRSYIRPFVIMSIIPYGILGSILGHWIVGISIGLLSLFGTIALCGVVVNDSLVLVAKFVELKNKGWQPIKAIEEAGKTRLRAIVLTSLTTFAGLTPMLLDDSSQAQFLIPMAVSLGFGILFATFTTLFALPIILSFQESISRVIRRSKTQPSEPLVEH